MTSTARVHGDAIRDALRDAAVSAGRSFSRGEPSSSQAAARWGPGGNAVGASGALPARDTVRAVRVGGRRIEVDARSAS